MSNTIEKSQLLNAREVIAMLHVSQRHLWRMRAAGKLPKPVKIGGCVRWSVSDVEAWIEMGCPSQQEFELRKKASRL